VFDGIKRIYFTEHNGIESIKFIASEARSIYKYKNTGTKNLKCNGKIFFNKNVSHVAFLVHCRPDDDRFTTETCCLNKYNIRLPVTRILIKQLCLTVISEYKIHIYYIKNQQDATLAVLFISHCKITLHVPDAFRVHHQEY